MGSPVENKFLLKYFYYNSENFYPSSSTALYFNIFSGLIMAIAVEHCGLHNRIALRIIMLVCLLILNSIFWYTVVPRMNASLLVCYYAWMLVHWYTGLLMNASMLLDWWSTNADMSISGKWHTLLVCWCMFMYQCWHSVWLYSIPPVTRNDMFADIFSLKLGWNSIRLPSK